MTKNGKKNICELLNDKLNKDIWHKTKTMLKIGDEINTKSFEKTLSWANANFRTSGWTIQGVKTGLGQ